MRHEHVTDMGPDRDEAGKKKWGAEMYIGMLNGSKLVLPYSRLEGLAGLTSFVSVAMW
jgi:hypothetical protein